MALRPYLPLVVVAVLGVLLTACPGGPAAETPRATTTPESTPTEAATATPEETAAATAEATPEATPAATERAHEFSVEALYAHIPPELHEFCPEDQVEEGTNTDFNSIVARCTLPEGSAATNVDYELLEDPAQLEDAYLQRLGLYNVEQDQGECPGDIPSEATYSVEGHEDVGRFACAIVMNGGPHILWSDTRFAMIMEASNAGGEADMAVLHEWWAGPESGPVEAE